MASTPRMEHVFFHTHSKISHSILRHSSYRLRSTIEHFVLGLAVCGFCVVLLSHVTFVHRGDVVRGAYECDANLLQCETGGGVTLYSILIALRRSAYDWFLSSFVGIHSKKSVTRRQIPISCLTSLPGFSDTADVTHILLDRNHHGNNKFSRAFTVHGGRHPYNEMVLTGMPFTTEQPSDVQPPNCVIMDPDVVKTAKKKREWRGETIQPLQCPVDIQTLLSQHGYLKYDTNQIEQQRTVHETNMVYSYSPTKGLLLLDPSIKQRHNITTQFVIVSPSDVNCFGDPFAQTIVFSLVGPDTVILNWVLGLQQLLSNGESTNPIRFVYHWKTGKELDLDVFDMDHYAFSSSRSSPSQKHPMWRLLQFLTFKLKVFLSTLFIFFLTTSLVSFTFQETQDRMIEFTLQLQTIVRARLPLGGLIIRHILEVLVFVPVMVGIIFFLIEFYAGDKFLAFMVLSMVWIAEVFSAISIRSIEGMHFFPRVFFLYFTLFHVYFFSCPIGFTYASLGSTALFLVHTMLFFFNRYELPAMHAGLVTSEMPRMIRMREANVRATQPVQLVRSTNDLLRFPDLTNPTEPPELSFINPSEQYASTHQNAMRSYVAAASTSLQSIRSLASMASLQSLADRASPNWLYTGGVIGNEEDDDSYEAYIGDGTRSSLSMNG